MYGSCMRAGVYTSCAHGRFKLMMSIAKSTCKQTVTRYVYSHKFYLYIICSRTYTDITKCQLLYATMTTYGNYEHTYGKNSTLSSYRLRQKTKIRFFSRLYLTSCRHHKPFLCWWHVFLAKHKHVLTWHFSLELEIATKGYKGLSSLW